MDNVYTLHLGQDLAIPAVGVPVGQRPLPDMACQDIVDVAWPELRGLLQCGPEVGGVHINIVVNFEDKPGPGAVGGVQPLE